MHHHVPCGVHRAISSIYKWHAICFQQQRSRRGKNERQGWKKEEAKMKTKLLALFLLAGSAMFAAPRVVVGVGVGVGPVYVAAPPPPAPVVAYAGYARPGFTWVAGYYYPAGPRWYWHAGYWARPPYAHGYWVAPRYYGHRYYGGYWRR
jgi:hypothetical protein